MTGRTSTRIATVSYFSRADFGVHHGAIGQAQNSAAINADKSRNFSRLDKDLIDTSADPCADFFQYACGNFSKLYPFRMIVPDTARARWCRVHRNNSSYHAR